MYTIYGNIYTQMLNAFKMLKFEGYNLEHQAEWSLHVIEPMLL